MLHHVHLDAAPARPSNASSRPDASSERFDQLLAKAEELHRSGRQRFALLVIDQIAELVSCNTSAPLDALLGVICLRKRVVLAMSERETRS